MSWTLAGVTIHPDDKQDSGSLEAHYAIQDVIDSVQSVISFYGAGSERRSLQFKLALDTAGSGGLNTLKTAVVTDANVALVSDQGAEGNWRLLKLDWVRVQALNHTLPVYDCAAEMIKAA